jgi:hypothetical protein
MGLSDFLTLILEVILISIMMHYAVNLFFWLGMLQAYKYNWQCNDFSLLVGVQSESIPVTFI